MFCSCLGGDYLSHCGVIYTTDTHDSWRPESSPVLHLLLGVDTLRKAFAGQGVSSDPLRAPPAIADPRC